MPTDLPNTKLFNFVDTPATIQYSQFGEGQVPLDANPIIDVTGYRRVNVRIGSTKASSWSLYMGKISGSTLSVENMQAVDNAIHSFDVTGPEIALWLKGGTPKSREKVQLWVYLRS
jgi:hypothetical protein